MVLQERGTDNPPIVILNGPFSCDEAAMAAALEMVPEGYEFDIETYKKEGVMSCLDKMSQN